MNWRLSSARSRSGCGDVTGLSLRVSCGDVKYFAVQSYWLLATGYWLLAIGYWLLAIGYRVLARIALGMTLV
jgi:hypothetical protein